MSDAPRQTAYDDSYALAERLHDSLESVVAPALKELSAALETFARVCAEKHEFSMGRLLPAGLRGGQGDGRIDLEAVRRDAVRYRWLRSEDSGYFSADHVNDRDEALDEAIDEAMKTFSSRPNR